MESQNTAREMRKTRQERILRAIRHEPNDRTPLMLPGDCALVRYTKPDASFAWMVENMNEMYDLITDQTLAALPKIDYMGGASGKSPRFLGAPFLGKTKLPGRELPEDVMWQPVLGRVMLEEDYDFVASHGWNAFRDLCLHQRLGISREALTADMQQSGKNVQKLYDAGFPFLKAPPTPSAFDFLCLSRGPMEFMVDLLSIPDEVHAALDAIVEEYLATSGAKLKEQVAVAATKGEALLVNVNPCVYANCDMVSRHLFEEFGWPLIRTLANHVIDSGAYVFFHMDTNWTSFLDYFSEFPKGKCIFDSDGGTDLLQLRELHGDRFAITGDIAPALLAFGTPDEVYAACRKQIEEMGSGYILAPACSLPANTPKENIDAMYAAV